MTYYDAKNCSMWVSEGGHVLCMTHCARIASVECLASCDKAQWASMCASIEGRVEVISADVARLSHAVDVGRTRSTFGRYVSNLHIQRIGLQVTLEALILLANGCCDDPIVATLIADGLTVMQAVEAARLLS